jgi:signal transduction histidine kinase
LCCNHCMPDTPLSAQHERSIELEKVDLLLKGFKLTTQSTFVGPALIAWLFVDYVGLALVLWPAAWMYVLLSERFFFFKRYAHARPKEQFVPHEWALGVTWRLGLVGITLACWTMAAMATGNETAMFYAVTLTAITAAGALTQFCIYPKALWAFVTPYLLGIAAQLVWLGSKSTLVSAFFIFVFWATLIAASRRFSAVMHREITQRYRNAALVTELSAQKERAEEASAAKTRFLAAASHDLRQPVHAVALLSGALQNRLQHNTADAESQEILTHLQSSVAQFSDVVDEVMDIARLDAGAITVQWQAVSLSHMLQRVDSTFRALAQDKGLVLSIRLPGQAQASVHADPALLWRVLSNLVSNALRYTTQGTVMVAVRPHQSASSLAGTHWPASWRIEVRDSGPGIAVGEQERIFEEFYQLHNPQRSSKEGLGLGLAVATRCAGLMNLRIALNSNSGCGSTFSIVALALSAQTGLTSTIVVPTQSYLQGMTALVVDDDEASRNAVAHLLRSWGLVVCCAANSQEAAEQCYALVQKGLKLQVLVTDHWLPGQESSEQVVAAVQAAMPRQQAAELHIAVFTGDISLEAQSVVQRHSWHFEQKPVRPATLQAWLNTLA